MSVIIRNSLDKPFGKLANDAILPFKVGTRVYSSVVNYVYANLLPESTFKEELSHTLPKDILQNFDEIRKHLKKSTIQSAASLAITEKAKQNEIFAQKLMDTDNLKIIYYSQNNYLGVGRKKDGENIYGQVLEKHRNEMQIEQHKIEQKDDIYMSYIAEINLKKAFRKHNLEKYISKDKKRSIKKLVDALVREYGKTEVYFNAPDIDTILILHEKRNIHSYTDPNSLIRVIRKNEVRNVLKKNLFELKNVSLETFVDYIVSRNVTISEDKTVLKNQTFDILPSKREEFVNRILDLYSAKALPDEVRDKIKKFKSLWYFPSDKDIEFFETENIKLPELASLTTTYEEKKNTIKIFYDDILSPLNENSILIINNLKFKSISHYIAFELNKLYGQMDPNKLYLRMKDLKTEDLEKYNKMVEKDVFTTTKNKLLEDAINIKHRENNIKNLLFSLFSFKNLEFEDSFNLEKTNELYNKYKDKINLTIHKIPSFEKFVEKDKFLTDIIKDKIDFYFMILDNLMVHVKSKHTFKITYDDLVKVSPFYSHLERDESNTLVKIPEYLIHKNKQYNLNTYSLKQIWSIVFNGMKQSEKIIGKEEYDIRYKSLLIWSKYFLGQSNKNLKTLEVMQSRQEDVVLVTLLSILSKLKEVNLNLRLESFSIDNQDLQTATSLCLGKVRVYKHNFEKVEENLEFEEENERELYDEEIEIYDEDEDEDDQNFEGFNLQSRMKFDVFLTTYFKPLKNKLDFKKMEDAVYKILNSKIPTSLKHQNLNFFVSSFKTPSF